MAKGGGRASVVKSGAGESGIVSQMKKGSPASSTKFSLRGGGK